MTHSAIEALLERKIGISAAAIGPENLLKVIRQRMRACQIENEQTYYVHLTTSIQEWQTLVETIVVPETWFFRNHESFSFLGKNIVSQWQSINSHAILRILSIPCSTGEEPYSIAMTLLDAGFFEHRFHVDAIDISESVLQRAKLGRYTLTSFRSKESLFFRTRYFSEIENQYQISAKIRNKVRFFQGNLRDDNFLRHNNPYDVIFCRNLLIYWDDAAKMHGLKHLERLLKPGGILFVGHAERPVFCENGFEQVRHPGVFACRKLKETVKPQSRIVQPVSGTVSPRKLPPAKRLKVTQPILVSSANSTKPNIEHPENLLTTAQKLADQGCLQEALTTCEAHLDIHMDHSQAYFLMGIIYQALGEDKQAILYFNKTVYLEPEHVEALIYLIRLFEKQRDQKQVAYLRRRLQRIRARTQ